MTTSRGRLQATRVLVRSRSLMRPRSAPLGTADGRGRSCAAICQHLTPRRPGGVDSPRSSPVRILRPALGRSRAPVQRRRQVRTAARGRGRRPWRHSCLRRRRTTLGQRQGRIGARCSRSSTLVLHPDSRVRGWLSPAVPQRVCDCWRPSVLPNVSLLASKWSVPLVGDGDTTRGPDDTVEGAAENDLVLVCNSVSRL